MGKLVIILMVYLFVFSRGVFAHSEIRVVEMTPSGFEPQGIEVDENSSVIFINKDKEARWPASNVHPTHELYPQFDPKKPIQPGESWPFKPTKVGEWKFHDHLFPHMRGTIIVRSEKWEVGSGKGKMGGGVLSKMFDQFRGWLQEFMNEQVLSFGNKISGALPQSKKEDAAKRWADLKQKYQGQAGSEGNIHDQAHLAGVMLYREKGFGGIAVCSSEFAFGCFHGFLDEAFKKDLSKLDEAEKACSKLGPGLSGPVASCIHGIGHGVASFHGSSDLKASLSSCRQLGEGREYCFDGVFMEFVRSAQDNFFKKDDPLYPCDALEGEFGYAYSFSCGRNQPSLLMKRFGHRFDEVVGICLKSDSKQFKEACFDSLGFSIASGGDVEKIIQGCQSIGTLEYVIRCAKAAAGELVFQEVPGWYEKSQAVCNGFPSGKDTCLEYVKRLINEYSRTPKVSFIPNQADEDINIYLRDTLRKCYETDGRDGCYKGAAEVLYKQFGLSATLKTLSANENYPEVYARCHEVTHYLSRFEYEKQKDISKVYAQCDSTCHGGCYHGTLEAYLKQKQSEKSFKLADNFPKVCGKKEDYQKPIEFNECLHGMGHAAMFVTEMELRDSLALCDTFESQEYKDRCYTGVFMENSSSSTSFDHASIYIKENDPFYPCNSLEEKYLPLCWQYQSSYFSILSKQDWSKVATLCLQIPKEYQDRCFRTIGTNQVGFTTSLATMKKGCDLMPDGEFRNICVTGVVSSLSYRFVGNMQKMIDFCAIVDPDNKESCFRQVGMGILDWDKNKDSAMQNCNKIPDPKGKNWCMSVI